MIRTFGWISLLLAGTVAAHAGQIQIGGVNGLTDSYITAGGTATANTGGATEQNFDVNMFANAQNGSAAPTPYAGYNTNAASAGTITDTTLGVTFNVLNNGLDASGNSSNYWMLDSSGNPTMTIPIGIFGATDVWTLVNSINDSTDGSRDENISFIFGTTATGGTLTDLELKLQNSGAASASGQIQNAVSCPSDSACASLSNAAALTSSSMTSVAGTGLTSGLTATVLTDTVYTSAYNGGATGAYAGTTGTVGLEDEGFYFTGSALAIASSEYLVAIEIKEPGTEANSALGISAITVDPGSSTPEPSTSVLLLGGVAAFALAGALKKRNSRATA